MTDENPPGSGPDEHDPFTGQQPPVTPGESTPPSYPPPPEQPPSGYPQPGYGQPQPGQGQPPQQGPTPGAGPAYGQPGSGYPPPGYGQTPGTGPQYGQQPHAQPYPAMNPPKHPQATLALVLSLVGLIGGFLCALPLLLCPVAWWAGAKAEKEIDAAPQQYSGRSEASSGKIIGIIGTAFLAIGLLLLIVIIVLGISGAFDETGDYGSTVAIIGVLR